MKRKQQWLKISYMSIVIAFLLLISSCEFQSYEEYSIKPYDGALTFTRITKKAQWQNRYDHAAVAFDDKLWVLGGYNPGEVKNDTYYEDVWSSEDGISWELITDDAPWLGRRGHEVVAFNDGTGDAMYLIGGFSVNETTGYRQYNNDVWRSTDGKNWTQIKERTYPTLQSADTLFPRMDHAALVANHGGQDYIYMIGGRTQLEKHSGTYAHEYFDDVWRSTNGIQWEKLANNSYGERAGHAATVDPATGTIYLQGGNHGLIFEAENNAARPSEEWMHLWSSPDGVNWTASYDSTISIGSMERAEHEMVFYNNTLWTFPGENISTLHYLFGDARFYLTWRLDEGNLWSIDSEGSDLRARHSYATVLFKDKIWFLGGVTSNRGQENDVWTAE